jgi:hypothetical protein
MSFFKASGRIPVARACLHAYFLSTLWIAHTLFHAKPARLPRRQAQP